MRREIQIIVPIVRALARTQVEDRLVDAEVDAAEVDRDPRFELELVLRLELFVLAGAAEDQQQQDRDRRGRRRGRSGPWPWCSAPLACALRLAALGSSGSKRWAMPWAAKEIGEEDERPGARPRGPASRSATGRRAGPRSPSARPGRGSSRRRSPSPAGGCRRRARVWRGASASDLDPALRRARRRRRRRSRASGSPAEQKDGERGGQRPVGRRTWEET